MRGLAALQIPNNHRARTGNGEIFESNRLNLMGMLPINLRHFLADRLSPMLRIEGDSTLAFDPRWGDRAIRELARAIRRFSAERAREPWRECAVNLGRLGAELARMPAAEQHVVICLRCTSIGVGTHALSRHQEAACLAIELNRPLKGSARGASGGTQALVPDGMRAAVENFRRGRTQADLPHYDLDCYLSNDQMVFTWRPLPPDEQLVTDVPAFAANGRRHSDDHTPSRPERRSE